MRNLWLWLFLSRKRKIDEIVVLRRLLRSGLARAIREAAGVTRPERQRKSVLSPTRSPDGKREPVSRERKARYGQALSTHVWPL